MGQAIPGNRPGVAASLAACGAVVRLPAGDPQDDLYDERMESLNRSLRKVIKIRGSFPTDEAALKLLFLAIRNAGLHWRRPIEWTAAVGQFAILFGDRFEPSAR